ncbi:hypothetical protein LC607_12775 [Nostoc sp. CHAB 5824]|nr:hypothetical protein [Nostoc sp. CHAB 5824]
MVLEKIILPLIKGILLCCDFSLKQVKFLIVKLNLTLDKIKVKMRLNFIFKNLFNNLYFILEINTLNSMVNILFGVFTMIILASTYDDFST